ncbi:MAG TPA: diguanylate cyclase [Euzebyales bacterium]|nr:diguanylate cyclase [Euzebyales bacterium]
MISREHSHISAVPDEIVIDDLAGLALLDTSAQPPRVVWTNPAFTSVLAVGADDVAGAIAADVVDAPGLADAVAAARAGAERTLRWQGAGAAAIVLQVSPIGEHDRVLLVARPAHSTPRAAMYDAVTGLASPALFREHLQLALNRRAREGDDLAVVAVSAAGFASAWQADAEAASLLQTRMAERIELVVRDADVLAARRPGAFLLLVIDPTDAVAAATLASERMVDAFATPLVLPGRLQPLDVHIGIGGAATEDGPDEVLARAEAALQRALEVGGGVYRVELP